MRHFSFLGRGALGAVLAIGIVELAVPAWAQDAGRPGGGGNGPTTAEFNKLKDEVREQRQLILQILQNEQSRYDMLLKLIGAQGAGGARSSDEAPMPASPEGAAAVAAAPSRARANVEAAHRNSFVEGKVSVNGPLDNVYVYVDGIKGPPVRGKTVEIKQENKQFVPRMAVVQAGTSLVFPNFDTVYHNVFSTSPRNTFDLGSYRAGDKPRAVTLTAPGVVEIFCNMHQKMTAEVLVVPNQLYTKVRPDGTFRLDNVPVGARRVVAWSPNAKPVQQKVDVSATGAQTSFVLEREDAKAHANKLGQAYGSYRE